MKTEQDYSNFGARAVLPGLELGLVNAVTSSENSWNLDVSYLPFSSESGFCANAADRTPIITLGGTNPLMWHGILIRGRRNYNQYTTQYELEYTKDGKNWNNIESGTYSGNNDHTTTLKNKFSKPVSALAIRLKILQFYGHPCLQLEVFVSRIAEPWGITPWNQEIAAISSGTGRVSAFSCHDADHCVSKIPLDYQLKNAGSNSWCANAGHGTKNYVEITTGRVVEWTRIVTQGRQDYAQWVKTIKVSYSLDGMDWKYYDGGHVFSANSNQNAHVEHKFDPFYALKIRVYPESWHVHPSMRMEAYYRFAGLYGGIY